MRTPDCGHRPAHEHDFTTFYSRMRVCVRCGLIMVEADDGLRYHVPWSDAEGTGS